MNDLRDRIGHAGAALHRIMLFGDGEDFAGEAIHGDSRTSAVVNGEPFAEHRDAVVEFVVNGNPHGCFAVVIREGCRVEPAVGRRGDDPAASPLARAFGEVVRGGALAVGFTQAHGGRRTPCDIPGRCEQRIPRRRCGIGVRHFPMQVVFLQTDAQPVVAPRFQSTVSRGEFRLGGELFLPAVAKFEMAVGSAVARPQVNFHDVAAGENDSHARAVAHRDIGARRDHRLDQAGRRRQVPHGETMDVCRGVNLARFALVLKTHALVEV